MSLDWFLANYRKKLLGVFFDNPNAKLNLHQLASRAKLDPGNATRYVQECVLLGLLKKEKQKNRHLISPNYGQPHVKKIFELFEVDRTWRFITENQKLMEPVLFLTDILAGLDSLLLLSLFGFHSGPTSLSNNSLHLLIVKNSVQPDLLVKKTIDDIWADFGSSFDIQTELLDETTFRHQLKKSAEFLTDFWLDRVILAGETYLWKTLPELNIKLNFTLHKESKFSNYPLVEGKEAVS